MAKKNPFLPKKGGAKAGSKAEEKAEGPKIEAAEERAYKSSLKKKSSSKR